MSELIDLAKFLAVVIPIIGLTYAGLLRLLKDVHVFTSHVAEIRETVRLTSVAIEAMRMVDSDTLKRLQDTELRVAELENYLQNLTDAMKDKRRYHPFKIRNH